MANQTPNLNLTKPLQTEYYDIGVHNANSDIIDSAIGSINTDKSDKLTAGSGIILTKDTVAKEVNVAVSTDAIKQIIVLNSPNILQRNKLYAIGDISYSQNLPSWVRLECVISGTTAATEPVTSSPTSGMMIVDGTATFIIDDVRDLTPVGSISSRLYLPNGYIRADGSALQRANYPRLVKLATDKSLFTTDQVKFPGLFGQGNGTTTFVVPDFRNKFTRFCDNVRVPGSFQEATSIGCNADATDATVATGGGMLNSLANGDGIFGTTSSGQYTGPATATYQMNKVRPANIGLIPIIKY